MNTTDRPPPKAERTDPQDAFQLSPAWIIVGLLAIAVGIGCGLVMSSATFLR